MSSATGLVWTTGDTLLYFVTSYTLFPTYMQYTPGQKQSVPTKLLPPLPDKYSDIVVRREFAVSKDGTRIPMSIIMKRGTRLDGSNPTVIYGYGGYGHSVQPGFDERKILWCRAGGIHVDTNIRGGGEYGDAWHKAGNLLKKQNVFGDFAACAQHLIARGYARPAKLAAMGGSNGGLLMGAQITQHPELYKCIVSEVGLYDMLRFERRPNGPTEFGTVKNPAQFAALYAYSPYQQVRDGVHYPDILMVAGDNDGRVDPMNSRKMLACLQAAAVPGSVLLLRTSATAGHGMGSSRDEYIAQAADEQAFLMHELGMTPVLPSKKKRHAGTTFAVFGHLPFLVIPNLPLCPGLTGFPVPLLPRPFYVPSHCVNVLYNPFFIIRFVRGPLSVRSFPFREQTPFQIIVPIDEERKTLLACPTASH